MKKSGNHVYSFQKHFKSLRTILITSFILIICAILILLAYYFYVLHDARLQTESHFLLTADLSKNRLEKTLSESKSAAKSCAYSVVCQNFLLSDNPAVVIEARRSSSDILNYANMFDHIKDILLFSDNNRYLSTSSSTYSELSHTIKEQYINENSIHFKHPYYAPLSDVNKEYLLYFFPVYGSIDGHRYLYNTIVGTIIYDLEDLLSQASTGHSQAVSVLYLSEKLLASSRTLTESEQAILRNIKPDQTSQRIDGHLYFIYQSTLSDSDIKLISLLPYEYISTSPLRLGKNPILLIILFLFFIIGIMVLILHKLNTDIIHMSDQIRMAETSLHPIDTPYIRELEPITQVLNNTLHNLQEAARKEQELTSEKYEALLAQARVEMLSYRNQINPHFLFNSLESVRSLAHHYKATPVETLVGGMADMFRYSIQTPMIVPLRDELRHLNAYLDVLQIRFPNRYRFIRSISADTMNSQVLSMLLQPLVENAVQHAFIRRMNGTILIRSYFEGQNLLIQVADNGVGMDKPTLDSVISQMQEQTDSLASASSTSRDIHLGLSNIHHRLKLMNLTYGEKAELHIRSKKGYYTVVEIRISHPDIQS